MTRETMEAIVFLVRYLATGDAALAAKQTGEATAALDAHVPANPPGRTLARRVVHRRAAGVCAPACGSAKPGDSWTNKLEEVTCVRSQCAPPG